MKEADRPILTVLDRATFPKRSTDILWILDEYYDIVVSETTFYRRIKHLQYADLVTKVEKYYTITELGERLLNEELSDEEVADISQRLKEGPDD